MGHAKLSVEPSPPNTTLTHRELIDRGGGLVKFGDSLTPPVAANTVKGWRWNDSIPGEYWQACVDARLATFEELAAYAALKRRAAVPGNDEPGAQ